MKGREGGGRGGPSFPSKLVRKRADTENSATRKINKSSRKFRSREEEASTATRSKSFLRKEINPGIDSIILPSYLYKWLPVVDKRESEFVSLATRKNMSKYLHVDAGTCRHFSRRDRTIVTIFSPPYNTRHGKSSGIRRVLRDYSIVWRRLSPRTDATPRFSRSRLN